MVLFRSGIEVARGPHGTGALRATLMLIHAKRQYTLTPNGPLNTRLIVWGRGTARPRARPVEDLMAQQWVMFGCGKTTKEALLSLGNAPVHLP